MFLCLGAGLAIAVLDLAFHAPLQTPGWRGMASLALMVLARCATDRAWAATATAATAAVLEGAAAAHSPWAALFVLLHGVVLDALLWIPMPAGARRLGTGIAAGLANASTPLVMLLLGAADGFHGGGTGGGLGGGPMIAFGSHFIFGFCGGLIAILLWTAGHRFSNQR